jgi:hypothetical protein
MSNEQQEQSAEQTTEMDESQGSLGVDFDPNDVSSYAQEVQSLINGEDDFDQEEQSQGEEIDDSENEEQEETESEESEESETEQSGEDEEESDDQSQSDTKNANRYRIKAKNDVERTALALHKANPTWTLEQSIEAAKKLHPDQSNEQQGEQQAGKAENVTLESIEAKIAELKQQRIDAKKTFDTDLEIELEEQIDALKDQRAELAIKVKQQQTSQEQQFYAAAAQSEQKAIELYPDAADPNSALSKEMARIDKELLSTDNPLIYDSNKALRVTQMAANNLRIAPRSSQKKQTTVRKVSTRPALQPSSGSTRSSAAPVALSKLDDPEMSLSEYEAMIQGLG